MNNKYPRDDDWPSGKKKINKRKKRKKNPRNDRPPCVTFPPFIREHFACPANGKSEWEANVSKWKIKDIYWVEGWRWVPRLDKVEKCSRMEVRKGGWGGEGMVSAKQRDSHPSSQRNPSASCLAGFITAPFITACLNNAVVVPIVNHVLTYIPSAHRTLPRDGGESIDIFDILTSRLRSNRRSIFHSLSSDFSDDL